jgi:tetratricopeptide (TPR) repeat protein
VDTTESVEQRIAQMNQEVAAYQRANKIEEGVKLADEAFFTALRELPDGHFLRAQSARNRGIMQQMAGNNEEAVKTLVVALDFYQKTSQTYTARRQELEKSGHVEEALQVAREQTDIARNIEHLQEILEPVRKILFGDQPHERK